MTFWLKGQKVVTDKWRIMLMTYFHNLNLEQACCCNCVTTAHPQPSACQARPVGGLSAWFLYGDLVLYVSFEARLWLMTLFWCGQKKGRNIRSAPHTTASQSGIIGIIPPWWPRWGMRLRKFRKTCTFRDQLRSDPDPLKLPQQGTHLHKCRKRCTHR